MPIDHRSIGELAYQLWQARGCPQGSAEQDWLEAERRLDAAAPKYPVTANQPVTASKEIEDSLKSTFPASDPPATQRPDHQAVNGVTRKTPILIT